MRPKYKLLLLALLAVVVYLPGLKAGYFVFDDSDIVFGLKGKSFSFRDLFAGGSGTYWRPLITATYYLDAALWDLDPALMHLENILLHALNTLLVYASARLLATDDRHELPLLIATLFCLHPINTEAVNWISGRTDPLATFFCLSGLYFLFRWQKDTGKTANCYVAGLCIFVGCLAKEVSVGMFLGAVLFCLLNVAGSKNRQGTGLAIIYPAVPFILFLFVYLKARALVFSSNDHGIEKVIGKALDTPLLSQVRNGLTSLGFYIKKLFIPSPLTFAIDKVPEFYLWIGIAVILLTLIALFVYRQQAVMLLLILAGIAPALINAVHQIAWTSHAERYLYLPAAVFALAICSFTTMLRHQRLACHLLVAAVLLYYFPLTVQRNLLWADQAEYLKQTVEQAPNNVNLRNNYGVVLATFGHLDEARRQFAIAGKLDPKNELVRINQEKYRSAALPTTGTPR